MKAPITIILCLFAIALAQKQRVAIMPTVADAEAKLTPSEQGLLMERLRAYASDVLPKSDFILLQQNYVIEKLGEENFFKACKEGSCVGELIAMVSADFGARCEVFVANNKKWLKFELYGTLIGEDYPGTINTFIEAVKDFNAMVALIDKKVPAAFKEIIPKAPPAQAKAVAPAPEPVPAPKPEPKPAYVAESVVPAPATVDEPYEPPAPLAAVAGEDEGGGEESKDIFSLGFRVGLNLSHLSSSNGSYNSALGLQLGLLLDWTLSDLLHLQPGLMYIQKGAKDYRNDVLTLHYIEAPLLLSLKLSAFRLNAGPYFGLCYTQSYGIGNDFGISAGLGFDIGMFYIGAFYDYGLANSYNSYYYSSYGENRTLGLSLGVNL